MAGASATGAKMVAIPARGKWAGGVRTDVKVRKFDPFIIDEPTTMGGTDKGPNPLEYLLGALMGCETVLMAIVAQEQNFTYESIEYDLKGTLDLRGLEGVEGARVFFHDVKGTVRVTTNEDEATMLAVAHEAERRCPVYTMMEAAGVNFDVNWVAVRPGQ